MVMGWMSTLGRRGRYGWRSSAGDRLLDHNSQKTDERSEEHNDSEEFLQEFDCVDHWTCSPFCWLTYESATTSRSRKTGRYHPSPSPYPST